jgi:hypothetical protein
MWKDGLHPDESTWEEIVAKAEMIEIADSVYEPRERDRFLTIVDNPTWDLPIETDHKGHIYPHGRCQ